MAPFVKASSDIFIKYLFGSVQNKDLLLSFINAVLSDADFKKIVEIEVANPFNIKTFVLDKESILDVKAVDEDGRQYNIEVQTIGNENFKLRSLYYWARMYSSQITEGQQYTKLKPVISINVLNFNLIKENKNFHNTFILTEKNNADLILTDNLVIHFLELPKLENQNIDNELKEWLSYLKMSNLEDDSMNTILERNEDIKKAHNEYIKFNQNDELREAYESRRKWQLDHNTSLYEAEQKGIEKGIEKEKTRRNTDLVLNLNQNKYSLEKIVEITDLPVEKIKKIINQN